MLKSDNESVVLVEEVNDFGLIIVKANFSDSKIRDLLQTSTGLKLPKNGRISIGKNLSIGWMSNDEHAIIIKNDDVLLNLMVWNFHLLVRIRRGLY